jgi:predicted nucleotidyltransferase
MRVGRRTGERALGSKFLSEKDRNLLTELKEVVAARIPEATVLLYGSVARGTATAESDSN